MSMTTMRSSFDAMRPNTWWGWCAMRIGIAAHGIAHAAAQQLMDRLAAGPPPQIPQRDIDGRTAAHFRAAAGEAQIADQMRLMGLDGQGITPQQIGRDGLMDVRLNGARAVKTLAEAGDPVVG